MGAAGADAVGDFAATRKRFSSQPSRSQIGTTKNAGRIAGKPPSRKREADRSSNFDV
jgi:hypothetical protein